MVGEVKEMSQRDSSSEEDSKKESVKVNGMLPETRLELAIRVGG